MAELIPIVGIVYPEASEISLASNVATKKKHDISYWIIMIGTILISSLVVYMNDWLKDSQGNPMTFWRITIIMSILIFTISLFIF